MSKVFEKTSLAGIHLSNHILRSATYEGMSDDLGFPTESLIKKYTSLAKGGVGCIITGYMGVSQQGKSPFGHMVMIDRDVCIEPLAKVVKEVHLYKTPIIAQIAHCGSQTSKTITGYHLVAPSRIGKAKAMTKAQIEQTIEDFVSAIRRAKEAGFDGVQLHVAHGYLLSAFVSPLTNRRTDSWGGDTKRRFHIISEILQRARLQVGDYPILIKMNSNERSKRGMSIEESVKLAQLMEASGCDGIEVSCGMNRDGLYTIRGSVPWKIVVAESPILSKLPHFIQRIIGWVAEHTMKSPQPHKLYNVEGAKEIKKAVNIPVIVVGGIDNLPDIKEIIDNGICDFVSMSRPLIIEPNLVNKFHKERQLKSLCINCNYCLMSKEPLRCHYGKIRGSSASI